MAPGFVTRNNTIKKCRILLITDKVLETEAHSSFLMNKGQVFWYLCRTHFAEPQMLVDNDVNRSFTQVEFVTDFTGCNPLISLDHFINGGNRIIGDHFVCLAWSRPFATLHGKLYCICLQTYDLNSGCHTLSPFFDRCRHYAHLPQLETVLSCVALIWTHPWIARFSFRII